MHINITLPNNKEVVVKPFLYKHIRDLLFLNSSLESKLLYLEDFILTKNLNVVEKFITLLKLRAICIKPTVSLNLDKTGKDVDIDYITESFEESIDIRTTTECDGIEITLDYPTKFCINTDNILSVIREVKIQDQFIVIDSLSKNEYEQVMSKLPAQVLNAVSEFVEDKKDAFTFRLLEGRKDISELNFLGPAPFEFINTIYACIDVNSYREYIYVLSKRIKDVNFLINSTMADVLDYIELYRRECEEEKEKLKN